MMCNKEHLVDLLVMIVEEVEPTIDPNSIKQWLLGVPEGEFSNIFIALSYYLSQARSRWQLSGSSMERISNYWVLGQNKILNQ